MEKDGNETSICRFLAVYILKTSFSQEWGLLDNLIVLIYSWGYPAEAEHIYLRFNSFSKGVY